MKEEIDTVDRLEIEVCSGWKEISLSEMTEPVKDTYNPDGSDEFIYIGLEHIEQETLRLNSVGVSSDVTSNKFKFHANDILFGKLRPYFRKVVKPQFDGICSTDIWVFRAKKDFEQNFLFYFLANKEFVDTANSGESGSRMPRADWNHLKVTSWNVPPIKEQTAIASILSSLDDKIDLLHRQNKTLEQLAETLFRQWFVEEAEESWEEKSIGEITEIKAGGDKPKIYSELKTEQCNIPIYSNGISNDGLYGYTNSAIIASECITISARGTIGFVCLRQEPYVPIVRLITVIPNENFISSKYLFFWAKSQNLSGTGTTQEQLTIPDFSKTSIILPPFKKMNDFTNNVNTLFFKIINNQTQIRTLTQTRDTLLPKLMSGEVRVKMSEHD